MSEVSTLESSKMGRPKRDIPTTSLKLEEDAVDLVRRAASFLGVSSVAYASRVLREQATKDIREAAAKFLEENPTPAATADKTPKKPGK